MDSDRERALAALWEIRMAAERWSTDESPRSFCTTIIMLAEAGMAGVRREAQDLAAEQRGGVPAATAEIPQPSQPTMNLIESTWWP